jgi:hypothetical protein
MSAGRETVRPRAIALPSWQPPPAHLAAGGVVRVGDALVPARLGAPRPAAGRRPLPLRPPPVMTRSRGYRVQGVHKHECTSMIGQLLRAVITCSSRARVALPRCAAWMRSAAADWPPRSRRAAFPRCTAWMRPAAAACSPCVVGRGHVSLATNSDTWHSKLVRDIGYLWLFSPTKSTPARAARRRRGRGPACRGARPGSSRRPRRTPSPPAAPRGRGAAPGAGSRRRAPAPRRCRPRLAVGRRHQLGLNSTDSRN